MRAAGDAAAGDAAAGGPPPRCPAAKARHAACPAAPACPAPLADAALMPRGGAERAVMLALRFVAAADDTGDAACWDAAFERAEAEFGPRDGALLVARAAALLRALRRDGSDLRFLPPPCRRLSAGEAGLLAALRARLGGGRHPAACEAPPGTRAALADLAAPIPPPRGRLPRPAVPPAAGRAARAML